MKKIISLVLSILMILSVSVGAFADNYEIVDGDLVLVTGGDTVGQETGQSVEIQNSNFTDGIRVASHIDANPVFSSSETVDAAFYLNPENGDVSATFENISIAPDVSQSAIVLGEYYGDQAPVIEYQEPTEEYQEPEEYHSVDITLDNVDITSTNTEAILTATSLDDINLTVKNENTIVTNDTDPSFGCNYNSSVILNAEQDDSKITITGTGSDSSLTVQSTTVNPLSIAPVMNVLSRGDIEVKDVNLTVVNGDEASGDKKLTCNLEFLSLPGSGSSTTITNSTVTAYNFSEVSNCGGDALIFTSDNVVIDSSNIIAVSGSDGDTPAIMSKTEPVLINSYLDNFEWKSESNVFLSAKADGTYASEAVILAVPYVPVNPLPNIKGFSSDGKIINMNVSIVGKNVIVSADVDEATLDINTNDLKQLLSSGVDTVVVKTKNIEVSLNINDLLKLADGTNTVKLSLNKDSATLTVGQKDASNILSIKKL